MTETTPVNLDDYADALRTAQRHVHSAVHSLLSVNSDVWADKLLSELDGYGAELSKRYEAVCNGEIVQAESGGQE